MGRAFLLLLPFGAGACTTFAFPPPDGTAPAGGDAAVAVDAGAGPSADAGAAALLDLSAAAKLCALVFQCPRLGEAIELALAIPLATPSSPLNFSACMDWLAGPIDPHRVGLLAQSTILAAVANAASCSDAYTASPIVPIDGGGGTCVASSCAGTALQTCSQADGTFTALCDKPLFDKPGTCTAQGANLALCVTSGACTVGLSCSGETTLVDCYTADTSTAYDCTLSGRKCVSAGAAACVVPGKLSAPCPTRQARDACDGTSVVHCAGGLLAQTEFDCRAVGAGCSTASGVARCVGSADVCTPFDASGDVNACSGTSVSLCVGGKKTSLDCQTIGRTCVAADATHTAHCG